MMLDVDDLVSAWRRLEAAPHPGPCVPVIVLMHDGRPLLMAPTLVALAQAMGGTLVNRECVIWGEPGADTWNAVMAGCTVVQ